METLKLPKNVVESEWKDDIDDNNDYIDFIAYKNEKEYISPKTVDKQTIEKIKQIRIVDFKRGAMTKEAFKTERLAA